uniref:DUF1985 domain-containing protein n=1 Tax=Brassica oleracea var. oleracea TaxID=109376 RepID=A0A0D3BK42_BRAOL
MSKATISSPNFQVGFKMFYWEEPPAVHSISYHTCWTLHTALKKALHDDEYEELKESKLGVFIKFQELGFDWASRLKYELWSLVGPEPVRFSLLEFENLTGLNCEYIEDLDRPHCVVTKELTSFWEMLGVHVEAGPSTQEIIAAFESCEGWSRDDHKRLARRMLDILKRGMLLWHFAVQRVIEQGNLLPHNNLLIHQIARPK